MINSKHEIIREAFKISRHSLIDYFRFYTIHLCKVTVRHGPLATNIVNLVQDYRELVHDLRLFIRCGNLAGILQSSHGLVKVLNRT